MAERWLPVDKIAAHLGVNPDTICKWMPLKITTARKLGRPWKFLALEVDRWAKKSRSAVVVDETQPCIAKIPTSKTLS
jgi:hypothetical protein